MPVNHIICHACSQLGFLTARHPQKQRIAPGIAIVKGQVEWLRPRMSSAEKLPTALRRKMGGSSVYIPVEIAESWPTAGWTTDETERCDEVTE